MLHKLKSALTSYRFSIAVRPYRADLVKMIARRVGEMADADDIVQTALEKAWRAVVGPGAEPMPPPAAFPYWLRLITFNAMKDHFRRLPAANEDSFNEETHGLAQGTEPSCLEVLLAEERTRMFAAAVDRLPEDLRHVLIMREIELLEPREVATALGITPENVRKRAERARRSVLEQMEAQ